MSPALAIRPPRMIAAAAAASAGLTVAETKTRFETLLSTRVRRFLSSFARAESDFVLTACGFFEAVPPAPGAAAATTRTNDNRTAASAARLRD
jgi:hypothetical protein